jgi:2-C-methyl-D-erythritol 4-phosphate cytidylyltransferase
MRTYAIIMAGGIGIRFGREMPKQFVNLDHKPIISYTLKTFDACELIDDILVVYNEGSLDKIMEIVEKDEIKKVRKYVLGGMVRRESSFNGLNALKDVKPDIVVIHDAVRPFVTEKIIRDSIEAVKNGYDGVDVGIKTNHTILHEYGGKLLKIEEREHLYEGQTPQTFKYNKIYKSYLEFNEEKLGAVIDDAHLAIKMNLNMGIVIGDENNIKITRPLDLFVAGKICRNNTSKKHTNNHSEL